MLENLGIHVTRSLTLKVKVDPNVGKKDVEVLRDDGPVKFHIQKSPFDTTKLIVFRAHELSGKYFLIIGKRSYKLSIKTHENHVEVRCKLPVFVYIDLQFRGLTFTSLLEDAIGENGGKKSHTIRLNTLLKKSPPNVIVTAFGMLVDCEGSIDHYRLFRKIRIRTANRPYLEDWLDLLNRMGIHASIHKSGALYALCIEGAKDFRKLVDYGFNLHHSIKRFKFQRLLLSYKRFQISRGSALIFYLQELKKIGRPITTRELATVVGKSKRTVNHYLKKLEDRNLVWVDKRQLPYFYS